MARAKAKRAPAQRGKARAKKRSTIERIEHEVPVRLEDFLKRVQRRLDVLERDVQRTRAEVRRRGIRVLREVSRELGKIEERGQASWRRLRSRYAREAVKILQRVEKAIAPPARRKAGKKRTTRKVRAGAGA